MSKQKASSAQPRIRRSSGVSVGTDKIPFTPRVQGITSDLSDLHINGRAWVLELGDALTDTDLERTTEGASTLKLTIHDSNQRLLNHPILEKQFDLELDDLWFRLVKVGKPEPRKLELTFEDREVARLRLHKGAKKVYRDRSTRAEFARRLVREDKKPQVIPFYCPQLHTTQPIADAAAGRANQNGKLATRQPGLAANAKITVKHQKASPIQVRNIERVLDVGRSMEAPHTVMLALVMTITQENDANSGNIFQQQSQDGWPASGDIERDTRAFLDGIPGHRGALAVFRSNPHISPGALSQTVQASAFPSAYDAWEKEAQKTVALYLGGTSTPTGGSTGTKSVSKPERFPFERKKGEDTWTCIQHLATEVQWACFCSSGIIYFIAETDLLRSKVRAEVSESIPGVDLVTFDYDLGKTVTEVKVTARARAWAAPPGTVIEVIENGPANGRYIVTNIQSKLGRTDRGCVITLKRPVAPLPEPAATTTSKPIKGQTGGTLGKGLARMNQLTSWHIPYVWGGGHGGFSQHPSGLDCSGAVSDVLHAMGLLKSPLASVPLETFGAPGEGKSCTIFANAEHAWMEVLDNGKWRAWGTSVGDSGAGGLGWHPIPPASYKAQFTKRHPTGL